MAGSEVLRFGFPEAQSPELTGDFSHVSCVDPLLHVCTQHEQTIILFKTGDLTIISLSTKEAEAWFVPLTADPMH